MGDLRRLYNNALRALARHDKERALRLFKRYISIYSVRSSVENKEFARVLHFTGNILMSLGLRKKAVRVWSVSCKIRPDAVLLRRINCLSVSDRAVSSFSSDRDLFFSIQMERYLSAKTCKHFTSPAERDMIFELISEYWRDLLRSFPNVLSLRREEKIRIFASVDIVFPFVAVDYMQRSKMFVSFFDSASDDFPCSCGTGLPYRLCCGSNDESDRWPAG